MKTVKLDKTELIELLKSQSPPLTEIKQFQEKGFGKYIGGFVDKWSWDTTKLNELDEETIYGLYSILKRF